MPKQVKGTRTKKKTTSRKPAKKTIKKKVIKKKTTKKLTKKKSGKKSGPSVKKAVLLKTTLVEPGPQPRTIPPVEEPAPSEEAIGTVTHYYSHLGVAVIQINKGALKTGATIHIKGHVTDFTQSVESMEYEHQHIDQASAGQTVGIKVKDPAREHDIVFLMK